MSQCTSCGMQLDEGVKFCPACGTAVEVPAPEPQTPPPPQEESITDQARSATDAFTDAISGKTNLVQRVINILTKPKTEWYAVNAEQPNTIKLLFGYAFILALIPTIATFLSFGIIGQTVLGITVRSFSTGLSAALVQLSNAVLGVYVLAMVIDMLAPSFDSEKNMGKSLQLAVYSGTAGWVAGILLLIPGLSLISFLAGLYSIYLFYTGIPVLKKTPQSKVIGYLVLTVICMIVIYGVFSYILEKVFGMFF